MQTQKIQKRFNSVHKEAQHLRYCWNRLSQSTRHSNYNTMMYYPWLFQYYSLQTYPLIQYPPRRLKSTQDLQQLTSCFFWVTISLLKSMVSLHQFISRLLFEVRMCHHIPRGNQMLHLEQTLLQICLQQRCAWGILGWYSHRLKQERTQLLGQLSYVKWLG
jgi:hypothetical protein